MREVVEIKVTARDQASSVLRALGQSLQDAHAHMLGATSSSQAFSRALSLLASQGLRGAAMAAAGLTAPLTVLVGTIWLAKKAIDAMITTLKTLAGAFMDAFKRGISFERGVAEIATISERADFPLQALRKSITEMAATYGFSVGESAKALYQAISAGATTAAEAQDVLTASGKLAVGGLANLSSAVDSLTSVVNAYQLEMLTANEAADHMFTAIRFGKTTAQELSQQLGNVVSFAAEANVSFGELSAALAALTLKGVRTEKATIQLRQVMAQIVKPTSMAREEARKLGIHFDSLAVSEKGLLKFLMDIKSSANFTSESFSKLFGNVRALNAVLALTTDNGAGMAQQLKNQENVAVAAESAFAIMKDTTSFLLDKLAALKDTTYNLFGEVVASSPEVKAVLATLIEKFETLNAKLQSEEFRGALREAVLHAAEWAAGMIKEVIRVGAAFGRLVKFIRLALNPKEYVSEGLKAIYNSAVEAGDRHLEQQFGMKGGLKRGMLETLLYGDKEPSRIEREVDDFMSQLRSNLIGYQEGMFRVDKNLINETPFNSVTAGGQLRDADNAAAIKKAKEDAQRAARKRIADEEQRARNAEAAQKAAALARVQKSGQDLWMGLNNREATATTVRDVRNMGREAGQSGDLVEMSIALNDLAKMKTEIEAGQEALRGGMLMAKDNLMSAKTAEDAQAPLEEMKQFANAYKALQTELNAVDRARNDVEKAMLDEKEKRTKRQEDLAARSAQAQAVVGRAIIQNVSAMGQEMIRGFNSSEEAMKAMTKRFIQFAGDLIIAMLQVTAQKKASGLTEIAVDSATAGAAVGADAAKKFGVLAPAIAPPLIGMMVAMIATLVDKFHEGGIMGPGGRRIPLNLGPGEFPAVLREGEAVIPTARMQNEVAGTPQSVSYHYHGSMLTDPSRARFQRHMQDDVMTAFNRNHQSGHTGIDNRRRIGRRV